MTKPYVNEIIINTNTHENVGAQLFRYATNTGPTVYMAVELQVRPSSTRICIGYTTYTRSIHADILR